MTTAGLERWPHQVSGLTELIEAIEAGEQRICLTSPTGGGKTVIVSDAIELACERRWPTVLYTHRRMLFEQTAQVLDRHGIDYGKRASGHDTALLRSVQLAMIQSEMSAINRRKRTLHDARIVLIDEAHCSSNGTMQTFIDQHVGNGATVIGITATPLDIGHVYDRLIVAGRNSDLRKCGAILPADHYAPDEPDLKKIKNYSVGEDLSDNQNRAAIIRPGVVDRVINCWKRYNPEQLPTLLFGPDVAGSLWFAEQFCKAGVMAAHIDGEQIWINGESYPTDQEHREWLRDLAEEGTVKVVCNRFVLREGIDWPFIQCGIFASVFGSLTSYLQSAGRLLRAHPSHDRVTLIDHGGNWHRHGSVNADREWDMGLTNAIAVAERAERMREKLEPEPITCPRCFAMRLSGPECPKCGYRHEKRSRMVVQVDGTLRKVDGDIYRPRRTVLKADTVDKWKKMYYRAKKSKNRMTFNQAMALYAMEEGSFAYPPKDIPLMPINSRDFYRSVCDVPTSELR